MTLYREHGIVLRTYKLGEADRIVVILTPGRGKVRAVAKGVRKTRSRFGSRLEPTTHVALQLYEGRELDIVTQAETVDRFRRVREDLDRLARAATMLEAVDQVALEGEADPRLYQMLLGALRTLDARDGPLVGPAFFWKLLAHEGVRPELDVCLACGAEAPLVAVDLDLGGTRCHDCRQGTPVSAAALDLLRRILGGGLAGVLDEAPSTATREVEHLATRALEHHLERRLRSVGMLDRG